MTVQELINQLQQFDPNMEVKFSYNYGDYWRTQVADDISAISSNQVKYSSYHKTDKVIERDYEEEDDDLEYPDDVKTVVILS